MSISLNAAADGNSASLQLGGVDIATLTSSGMAPASGKTIEANSGPDASAFSFRNKIIGGDFTTNPWQRGTSFTASAGANIYTADRWKYTNTTDGQADILKTADAPTAAQAGVFTQHCLHVDVTTADASITGTQSFILAHNLEGFNAAPFGFGQSGTRYVTLSFWHKHTKTGTYCVSLRNSATDRYYIAEYTQDVSDAWEKAVITIPVDTTGTWLYDNGIGILVLFNLVNTPDRAASAGAWGAGNFYVSSNQVNALDSTSNNFKIALVQLEAGSVATPFESRPYGTELALCQRYYYRLTPAAANETFCFGYAYTTTVVTGHFAFPVEMRVAPSVIDQSGIADNYGVYGLGGSETVCSSVPVITLRTTTRYGGVNFTVASGLTTYYPYSLRTSSANGANAYLGWSAEL
jgi:hypothetical protein